MFTQEAGEMKIYEIGTGYTPIPAQMGAATEIVVEELTKALVRQQYNVAIIDIAVDKRKKNNLPIIEVPVPSMFRGTDVKLGVMHKLKRVVYSINLASVLKKILKKSKEKAILHFHNQYNMYFFFKLTPKRMRKDCTIIYTNHSYIWHGAWEEIKRTAQKRYFQEIFSMKKADYVFVLNKLTKDTLIKHVGIEKAKIHLIDNGVNPEVYKPISLAEEKDFRDMNKIAGKRILIQVGSVCERKNQLGAVKLLLPFLKEDPNCVFMYAGGIISEEYQEEIKSYAKKNHVENQVIYLGELKPGKELNKYYSVADAMVFPSKSEGFSLVILEAMSAGTPVFVRNTLEFKLADDCLQYKDANEFEEKMRKYILDDDSRKTLSEKAREVVIKNYNWNKIGMDYMIEIKRGGNTE